METYLPLLFFLIALISTPGPAVITILASGLQYGFRRSIPLELGLLLGFIFNVVLSGPPIAFLFTTFPLSKPLMAFLGLCYTFYLAFKIATAPVSSELGRLGMYTAEENTEETQSKSDTQTKEVSPPLKFMDGLILSVLNPKAYLIVIVALSQFGDTFSGTEFQKFVKMGVAMFSIVIISDLAWLAFGSYARRWIPSARVMVGINRVLSLLLIVAVLWAFFGN